jgi:oligopeptide/dipeptide ABC transporter ATP-binding protein
MSTSEIRTRAIRVSSNAPNAYPSSRPIAYDEAEVFRLISKPIQGCPFAPRCEYAQEKCMTSEIALKEVAPDHFSACLRIQLREIKLAPMHLPDEVFVSK